MQSQHTLAGASEDVLAELTSAAYLAVLRHGGVRAPFIDVQLDIWRELRRVLNPGARAEGAAFAAERS